MKVEIVNRDLLADLYKNHGLFACTCYNTDDKYAEKVGVACNESHHMSGSRTEFIKFRIEGDRGTLEQIMRHEIGVSYDNIDKYAYSDQIEMIIDVNPGSMVKNMQSFRYIDKNDFTYVIPKNISHNAAALERYNYVMEMINRERKIIRDILADAGVPYKKAVEDANFILPRATNLVLTIGFTPEALIHFMHKRLCTRAQDEIREIAIEMKRQINETLPSFGKQLVPHCQHLLWCPEGKMCCGIKPTKEELVAILENKSNLIQEA